MEDCAVESNLSAFAEDRLEGAVEPLGELDASVAVNDLFVVLEIVAKDEARTAAVPLHTTHTLASALGHYAELVAVGALYNNVGFGVGDKRLDAKLNAEIVVVAKFFGDIAEVADGKFLGRTYNHNEGLDAEKKGGESVSVGEGGGLSVTTRGGDGGLANIGAIEAPALAA